MVLGVDVERLRYAHVHSVSHTRTSLALFSGITPLLPLGIYTAAAAAATWLIITGRDGAVCERKLTRKMKYSGPAM